MKKQRRDKPLTDESGEVRELTKTDMAKFRPAAEVLSPALMRRLRGAQKAPTKELISIRLSRDVLEGFRASGEGWQTRVDEALRAALKRRRA